jgi:Tol biopolymer transport system component
MKTSFTRRLVVVVVLLLLTIGDVGFAADAQSLQLVPTPDASQGASAAGNGDSSVPIVSPDGRYVLFASTANNLFADAATNPIPSQFPAHLNVFLRDRLNGTTALVSWNRSGTGGGNGDSVPAGISTNGRYALFESSASDLLAGDTNNTSDVFMRDLANGTTLLVSVSTNNGVGKGASRNPVMTPDGRYVAFVSTANNLAPGDSNSIADVFVRDMQTKVTTLASVGAKAGAPGATVYSSELPLITPDGRYVAFFSTATSLVPGAGSKGEIFVRDLVGSATTWASSGALNALKSAMTATAASSFNHVISGDGQFVAYEATPNPQSGLTAAGVLLRYNMQTGLTDIISTNANVQRADLRDINSLDMTPDGRFIAFVANTNGITGTTTCIEVWDAQTGTAVLASADLNGNVPTNSLSDWPAIDATGRNVAFMTSGASLVTNTLTSPYNLYVRDLMLSATTLVNADSNGIGSVVSPATTPRLSADGKIVAFESLDGSLVPGDRNHDLDVFVCDLENGGTELVSIIDPRLPSLTPSGHSALSSASADGRYVVFTSAADDLVTGDTNGVPDVFVTDRLASTNVLVSVGTNGVAADGASSEPTISTDGRYVAFTSTADNLIAGDVNKARDVFIRDLQAGTTALASANMLSGAPGNGASHAPVLSADGKRLIFISSATTLAPGTFTSATQNLFYRDLNSGTNRALTTGGVSALAMTRDGRFVVFAGVLGGTTSKLYLWDQQSVSLVYTNATSGIVNLAISPDGSRIVYAAPLSGLVALDRAANTNLLLASSVPAHHAGLRFSSNGRYLAYATSASVIPADTNFVSDVYLYDFQSASNALISLSYTGAAANGPSDSPDISADGRFIAYRSLANNLVPGDTNGTADIFLYDRIGDTTTLLSPSWLGQRSGDNISLAPLFSVDGQTIFLQSWSSDLVPHDLNSTSDIFAYNIFSSSPIPIFSASIVPDVGTRQTYWISWPVLIGRSYRVQFKSSLSDAAWQELNGNVSIIGSQGLLRDFVPGSEQRFYRVVCF